VFKVSNVKAELAENIYFVTTVILSQRKTPFMDLLGKELPALFFSAKGKLGKR